MESIFTTINLIRFADGLFVTFYIAIISIMLSILFGSIFGLCMLSKFFPIRALCRFYLEFVRIVPILALLYVFYFGLPQALGLDINNHLVAIIVFVIWGSAEIGDLVRSSLNSIDKHQRESALSLGLSWLQTQLFIIFPQANKRLLPAFINLFTRMIKTTALVTFIGVVDVLQVGRQIIEANRAIDNAPFIIYGLLLLLYFAICYPLSRFSKKLENKWN